MPYDWTTAPSPTSGELHLWPHQSLPPVGYARFIGITAALLCVPLIPLLGSVVLWGILPFLLMAIFGMKFALDQSRRDHQVLEVLRLGPDSAELIRTNAKGDAQHWSCNRYWASVQLHPHRGPVPNYVTLRGAGREVEIGAFLSEEERRSLFDELQIALRQ